MEDPHSSPGRHSPRPAQHRRRPLLLMTGAIMLAMLLALSIPALGRSAPSPRPTEVGSDALLSEGRPFLSLPWGSGPGQVGLARPQEGLARGPEAFSISPDGGVAILDSVNKRLLLVRPPHEIVASAPLVLGDPRFVAASDEIVYVLEEAAGRLLRFDWSGTLVGEMALLPFAEPVSGIFLRKERLFVELLHDEVYEVRPKGQGSAATVKASGRPADRFADRQAQAYFAPGRPARVRTVEAGGEMREQELSFSRKVEHLISLDADGAGRLALGVRLLQEPEASGSAPDILVTRLPGSGEQAGAILLDEADSLAFLGEPYRYGPDGRVYQPTAGEDAYTILVHDLPDGGR